METDNSTTSLETMLKDFADLNKDDPLILKNCRKIEEGIKNGNYTILQLVEQLESFLVHYAPTKRELGIEILTQVLVTLDASHLTPEQLRFIATFYGDRLKDHHQVIPVVIRGILALVKFENFPDGSSVHLLNSIFLNVPCQQQQCTERQNMYKIFQILLDRKTQEIRNMGIDYVYGVISAMDSERDPRNLLILFKWLPKFLTSVDLLHLTEEMFETIACYFPVDFRTPPEEKNAITRDLLADNLCPCLCALPSFAQFCIPLALEKLDSSLRIAKLDSLKLLKEGCSTFEVQSYQENSVQIWSLIYKELLQCSGDVELENACLETLKAYIARLSTGEENPFRIHLTDIIDTIKGNLLPDAKLFDIISKIILNITQSCQAAARITATEVLPIVSNTYNITKTPSHQVKLLRILVSFSKILNDLFGENDGFNLEELQHIPVLCVAALNHPDIDMKITAWNSVGVIKLSDDLKQCVFENIGVILTLNLEATLREVVLVCFKTLAIKYPDEIENKVIRKIHIKDGVVLKYFLEALARISAHKQFIRIVFPIIMQYCLGNEVEAETGFFYLRDVLEKQETNTDITTFLIENLDAIRNTINWTLQLSNTEQKRELLDNISVVLKILVGALNKQQQESLLTTEVNQIIVKQHKETPNVVYVVLLNGLLLRLHADVVVNNETVEAVFQMIFQSYPADYVNDIAVQVLAVILNKVKDEQVLEVYLEKILNKCNSEANNVVIKLVAWVTKAVLMRNYQKTNFWIEKVLELIEQYEEASTMLKTIMAERTDALSIKSHCQIQLFYRQKFFLYISNKLYEQHPNTSDKFLAAFGFLLQETPHPILLTAVEKVFKSIILCMDKCVIPEALCSICQSLLQLIENIHPLIEEHISDLLSRFLNLSSFKPSMKVRIGALKCLAAITKGYPVYKLLPHKQKIVFELAACLDDPKRLVRREAVEARSRWFLLDAPI